MLSNRNWLSYQFIVPLEIESFRIVLADINKLENIYFNNIQLASGSETTICTGIDIPK